VLYSVQSLPEQRIQVGSVQVDYSHVAVWRPYDPENLGYDAPWKSGVWRNIYAIRLPLDQPAGPGRITYGLTLFEYGGVPTMLPRVELVLSSELKRFLENTRGDGAA
jgi:hypothetical protein